MEELLNNVENAVAKVEIARFEQFLLLSQCFQKLSAADASECIYKWESVKHNLVLHVKLRIAVTQHELYVSEYYIFLCKRFSSSNISIYVV